MLKPVAYILSETTRIQEFYASIAALILIIMSFFVVGVIIKTKLGKFTFDYFDRKVLLRLPLYKIIKDTTKQLFGSDKMLFKHVALVSIWGNDTRMTAFVTEEHDDGSFTVFVPSGPAHTAGFIFHLSADKVQRVNYPVDKTMKTILSFGAGSKELINNISAA